MYFCASCLNGFFTEQRLKQHKDNKCDIMAKINKAEKAKTKFSQIKNQLDCPFVVYADFESILKTVKKEEKKDENGVVISEPEKNTVCYQEHNACSYSFVVVLDLKSINSL